jgi:hypothetical protein
VHCCPVGRTYSEYPQLPVEVLEREDEGDGRLGRSPSARSAWRALPRASHFRNVASRRWATSEWVAAAQFGSLR